MLAQQTQLGLPLGRGVQPLKNRIRDGGFFGDEEWKKDELKEKNEMAK